MIFVMALSYMQCQKKQMMQKITTDKGGRILLNNKVSVDSHFAPFTARREAN